MGDRCGAGGSLVIERAEAHERRGTSLRALLGLPDGPAWIWIFFVAPAVQIISHVDKALHLSDWMLHALARWREISHRLWTDLFGWLHISLPFDVYELDGLTLAVLCIAAAFGSIIRGSHASLQSDVTLAYDMAPPSRVATFAVIGVVAVSYFLSFIGLNIIFLYGDFPTAFPAVDVRTLVMAASVLGALAFVAFLVVARGLFQLVRVEILLAVLMFAIGWAIILAMSGIIGFDAAETYLRVRGLGWISYGLVILGMSLAVALVLAVNWRALPAILVLALIVLLGDKLIQALTPLAAYLRSL